MLGAPADGDVVSSSFHERFFVSICLLSSLILCGAFQVSVKSEKLLRSKSIY